MASFLATYDFLLVSMVLAAVLALTLYLPLMAGQLSVASPGFYALGGYIAAIMSTKIFPPGPGLYPVSLVLLEMAVAAVVGHHLANGFFMNWFGNQKGEGFEYHILAIGIALALMIKGSGALSLDRLIAGRRR